MSLNISYFENFYFFTTSLTEESKKNIIKFKNLAVIYQKQKGGINLIELNKIIKFCKKRSIKIYIEDDIKIAKKLNLDGVLISNNNKIISLYANHDNKKNLKLQVKHIINQNISLKINKTARIFYYLLYLKIKNIMKIKS